MARSCSIIQDTFFGTEKLEAEQRRLAERMSADADAVNEAIYQ